MNPAHKRAPSRSLRAHAAPNRFADGALLNVQQPIFDHGRGLEAESAVRLAQCVCTHRRCESQHCFLFGSPLR